MGDPIRQQMQNEKEVPDNKNRIDKEFDEE
jgi:hypothetical protein